MNARSSSDTMIAHTPADVKRLSALRDERHIPDEDQIAAVRSLYPGFDGPLLSKCRRGQRYGIQMREDALDLLCMMFAQDAQKRPKKPRRRKPNRVSCRLSDAVFDRLQVLITASGLTVQAYLEEIILRTIINEAKGAMKNDTERAADRSRGPEAAGDGDALPDAHGADRR